MEIFQFSNRIRELFQIKTPLIWINTREEEAAEQAIIRIARDMKLFQYYYYCATTGGGQLDPISMQKATASTVNNLSEMIDEGEDIFRYPDILPATNAALKLISECPDNVILVLRDPIEDLKNPDICRKIKDIVERKMHNKIAYAPIVILAPTNIVPTSIQDLVVNLEVPIFTEKENIKFLSNCKKQVEKDFDEKACARAATGLTIFQIKQTIRDSVNRTGTIDPKILNETRISIIKNSNVLTYIEPKKTLEQIGGHENLKRWIKDVKRCMSPEAKAFGIQETKGMIAMGLAGTGKTAVAEAIANYFGVPFIIFDLSKIMGGIVGQSESTARKAFETIKSVGRCVILIDECDKQFANTSGNHDGGTIARVFDVVLQSLQNNNEQFYILTANDISKLPSPLMRAGRLDTKWFFDFPKKSDRKDIFSIYFNRANKAIDDDLLDFAANYAEKFTGAEIEVAVNNIIKELFLTNKKSIEKNNIIKGIDKVSPIFKTNFEEIENLKAYAQKNQIPSTSILFEVQKENDKIDDVSKDHFFQMNEIFDTYSNKT